MKGGSIASTDWIFSTEKEQVPKAFRPFSYGPPSFWKRGWKEGFLEDKMEDKKIYVPGNGYRVLVKKGGLWIGSMRFKSYNKAYSHASKVEKALPDCTVLLVKVCKGELSLVKSYEEGRGEKDPLGLGGDVFQGEGIFNLCKNGIRMKENDICGLRRVEVCL